MSAVMDPPVAVAVVSAPSGGVWSAVAKRFHGHAIWQSSQP